MGDVPFPRPGMRRGVAAGRPYRPPFRRHDERPDQRNWREPDEDRARPVMMDGNEQPARRFDGDRGRWRLQGGMNRPNPDPVFNNARRGQGHYHRNDGFRQGFRHDQRPPQGRGDAAEQVNDENDGGRAQRINDNTEQFGNSAGQRPKLIIGYRMLAELADMDGVKIMEKLSDIEILSTFEKLTSEQKLREDWIRLVVTILAKLCKIEYKPIVVRVFQRVCQKEFLDQVLLHIVTMSIDSNKKRSSEVGEFYKSLCTLCHGILKLLPSLACDKLENLLKKASSELLELPSSVDGLEDVHKELELIKKELTFEKERLASILIGRKRDDNRRSLYPQNPPDDFRGLTVFPTIDDIVIPQRPFLRPSIVEGPYDSVDHYLDIHFRLMREDFVRPLREGVQEYLKKVLEMGKEPKKAIKVNNVRIYEKVQFLRVKTEEDRIGLELSFDPEKKLCKSVNWEYSKRFMMKSLLVLTRDASFTSLTLVTVAKRDLKELQEGRVLVELCEGNVFNDLFRGHFLMIECQVFFGAYCHVLEALQNFNEDSFPLKEYLVEASNEIVLPDYLQRAVEQNPRSSFGLPLSSDDPASTDRIFRVELNDIFTWPTPGTLGLDNSQFNALRGAVTHKVMLIQGPPGTGKTFLGLKVATSLLSNSHMWTSVNHPRPMLVVCYTNHALDQFLLGLMHVTKLIVRVGGGCKEPQLEEFSINVHRRRRLRGEGALYKMIYDHKQRFSSIRMIHDQIHSCLFLLKEDLGIVTPDTFRSYGIITEAEYGCFRKGSIMKWLLDTFDDEWRQAATGNENPVTHLILDFSECSFHYLEDATEFEYAGEIKFYLSFSLLEEHELKDKGPDHPTRIQINNILNKVKRELRNPATHPQYFFMRHPGRLLNLWNATSIQRWQIYRSWKDQLLGVVKSLAAQIEPTFSEASELLQESRMVEDQMIMANNLVIGMTTSYAASRQRILKQLKPRIVIVEEAAEVLEAHVLVALAGSVEHLILIGDHQQLRPNPAVYELARKYHLDVSMFERLIRNGVHCVSLSTQHRMRPEVARLICPAIYPNLLNHESVTRFPPVRGVTKNVFFLDHTHPEEVVKDALSFQNSHEANFMSSLVKYLLFQGYDASKITVLSTYKGQQFFFSKLRQGDSHLKDVRITVVDNFQGEEDDIILLSLVRSNKEEVVGFLKTENRVCVALSRARHGLFIIGNMSNMTAEDTVWRQVKEQLEKDDSFGKSLSLRCDIHGTITAVSSAQDFENCPNGGCLLQCGVLLSCGHICSQVCHTRDREHKEFRCHKPCAKEICLNKHICPDRCYEQCRPCEVPKTEDLLCGHRATMPCHRDPVAHKCQTKVSCVLPACGHGREAKCYQIANLDILPCIVPCVVRMNCGHMCEKTCHVLDDPQHEKYKCMKPCGQKKVGCTMDHTCQKMCHEVCEDCNVIVEKTLPCGHKMKMKCKEDPAVQSCKQNCNRTLSCGHKCRKICSVECQPCKTKVEKVVPRCGHTQWMECGVDPASFTECDALCERPLACGHRCQQECRHPCSSFPCTELVPFPGISGCGHKIMVPCNKRHCGSSSEELLRLCKEPCGTKLECGHPCSGTCGSCRLGRFHVACQAKCERVLICGHACKEPCAASCPPCGLRCTVQCAHTKCFRRCGEPCAPCKEKCKRQCAHRKCEKQCGDLCPMPPCDEPCLKKVKACGHDCIGMCGDPCLCRPCNEDKIDIFFGTEEDEDARFIVLPDCGHIFESSGLHRWVLGDDEEDGENEINKKVCPQCKTPITKCERYSNIVKQTAENVAKVKVKLYGNWKTIEPAARETRKLLMGIPAFPKGCENATALVTNIGYTLKKIEASYPGVEPQRGARKTPPLSLIEIQNLQQYVRILSNLSEILNAAFTAEKRLLEEKRDEICQFVESLCAQLSKRNVVRLSPQEASDVNVELKRLQRLVQLCRLESGPSFSSLSQSDKSVHASVSRVVRSLSVYESVKQDQWVQEKINDLAKKASVTITQEEIRSVVAALNMAQGHWFMCPNGHPYCITECGGAMEEGTCNECNARIGGRNHQLRSDNRFAPHIDGARAPLYPTVLMR